MSMAGGFGFFPLGETGEGLVDLSLMSVIIGESACPSPKRKGYFFTFFSVG
jgi:hypothetical protein